MGQQGFVAEVKTISGGNGALKPVIAKTFKFDDIVDANRFMESNAQIGKIVVTI